MLNTLTAISRGSSGVAVVGRCRHDIALPEHALAATAAGSAPGGASLVAEVEAVAAEMRGRDLAVATATAVDDLLTGPGRHAHVVLLDLDRGDGTKRLPK